MTFPPVATENSAATEQRFSLVAAEPSGERQQPEERREVDGRPRAVDLPAAPPWVTAEIVIVIGYPAERRDDVKAYVEQIGDTAMVTHPVGCDAAVVASLNKAAARSPHDRPPGSPPGEPLPGRHAAAEGGSLNRSGSRGPGGPEPTIE